MDQELPKFEVNGFNIFPDKIKKCEVVFYSFQPGDGTKYNVGIGHNTLLPYSHKKPYENYICVIYETGIYFFHENEFENVSRFFIQYFAEKMNVCLHTAKILIEFISSLPAMKAKLELLGSEWDI